MGLPLLPATRLPLHLRLIRAARRRTRSAPMAAAACCLAAAVSSLLLVLLTPLVACCFCGWVARVRRLLHVLASPVPAIPVHRERAGRGRQRDVRRREMALQLRAVGAAAAH